MAIMNSKKDIRKDGSSFQGTVDSAETVLKDAEMAETKTSEYKAAKEKTHRVKSVFIKKEKKKQDSSGSKSIRRISTNSAMKIIFYLMAADGQIYHNEEEKFDAIGSELEPEYKEKKEQIVKECCEQLSKATNSEDYYMVLQDGVDNALSSSRVTEDSFITPKLLVWDLLTVAYSDENYDEAEQKLLGYIVDKLNIDKAIFLELENCILTLMDLEKELQWIKTTDRPYLKVETIVNEIADRKNVIFESAQDLIAL